MENFDSEDLTKLLSSAKNIRNEIEENSGVVITSKDLELFVGRYHLNPQNFKLQAGEEKCLWSVVNFIKKKIATSGHKFFVNSDGKDLLLCNSIYGTVFSNSEKKTIKKTLPQSETEHEYEETFIKTVEKILLTKLNEKVVNFFNKHNMFLENCACAVGMAKNPQNIYEIKASITCHCQNEKSCMYYFNKQNVSSNANEFLEIASKAYKAYKDDLRALTGYWIINQFEKHCKQKHNIGNENRVKIRSLKLITSEFLNFFIPGTTDSEEISTHIKGENIVILKNIELPKLHISECN